MQHTAPFDAGVGESVPTPGSILCGVRCWILLALLSGYVGARAQGPIDGYLKGRGEADVAVGVSATGASEFIGGDGTRYDLPFSGTLLSAFATVGVTDELDVIASVPFVITDLNSGLQDAALFVKGRLLRLPLGDASSADDPQHNLDVLGALGVSVPLSDYEVVAAGAIGQRAQVVQPRLVAQYNRPGFFASTVLGYNYRFDELDGERLAEIQRTRPGYLPEQPSDYLTGLLRVGLPTRRLYVDAWLEVQRTLGGRDFVPDVEELPQPYRVDYQQIGGTAYYSEGGKWGLAASGAAFLGGRNTSRLWRLSGTVIYLLR